LGELGTFLSETEEILPSEGNGQPQGTIGGKREIVHNPTVQSPQG
jgi:hypothetical protein